MRDDVVSYRENRLGIRGDFFCLAFCVCGMLNVLLFSGCCSQRYRQAKVILVMHFVYEYFCE